MKILSSSQLKQADEFTVKTSSILSADLMERAANKCVDWLTEHFDTFFEFNIFCGLGNNGGDGLAIARMLYEKGYKVNVFVLRYSDKASEDFKIMEQRLKDKVKIMELKDPNDISKIAFQPNSIIIDSILGTGLNKPLEGIVMLLVEQINRSGKKVISIDIPTGLSSENVAEKDIVIKASQTLTFQSPKLAFMFPGNYEFVGDFTVLDIGLDTEFINALPSSDFFITKPDVKHVLQGRNKFSHKGTFGHALLISGSFGKMGASVLASKACLRSGAGLLTTHIPKCGYDIMQTSVPEAMVKADELENFISNIIYPENYDAIGIGPGIGQEKETQSALKLLIQNSSKPMVFDADALNILAENKTWLAFVPKNSILTPHPKEFERLFGKAKSDYERHMLQKDSSVKYGVYIVLKGAHTAISSPEGNVWFNSTGNPGMATGGSGDVLTGIITGLLAQGYNSMNSAVLGVYLHGLAGDLAAAQQGYEALIAGDIIGKLGMAFQFIRD